MNSKLLLRLIKSSMNKNRHARVPFLLVGILTVMTFYIISSMAFSDFLIKDKAPVFYGAGQIVIILMIGSVIIGIISAIVILYANAFIMKDRRREIGLYGILGLSQKSIVLMLLYETALHVAICLGGGILIGTFLNKLMILVLYKLAGHAPVNGFVFSGKALMITAAVFLGIYGVCFIHNILGVQLSKPVELLKSKQTGEKEPKNKYLTVIVGVITLLAGYYLAINCESTFDIFISLFVAIFLVVIGTYCLFTAGSIALLKAIKSNKKLYYKTNNFVGVANLMYRMKHNAVGLASICVLSTAVIILISCVASLVALGGRTISRKFPSDIMAYYVAEDASIADKFKDAAGELDGIGITDVETRDLYVTEWIVDPKDEIGRFNYMYEFNLDGINNWRNIYIITQDTYNRFATEKIYLEEGEVCIEDSENGDYKYLSCQDKFYVASDDHIDQKLMSHFTDASMDLFTSVYIIVPDDATGLDLIENDPAVDEGSKNSKRYICSFNVGGKLTNDELSLIKNTLYSVDENARVEIKQEDAQFFMSLYGGVLFIGVFLALIFVLATVLIIYYKQMSEGFEDNGRYQILKKVGLTEKEVKKSINRQIMILFFMPIVTAAIHALVASNIIRLFMKMLLYVDAFTFNMAIICSIAVFVVIYCIVYKITSKQYYKIVNFA